MPKHRSDHELGPDARPVSMDDLLSHWSEPGQLETGHHWADAPCLICGGAIGDQQLRVVVLISASVPADATGQLMVFSSLVHAYHRDPGPGGLNLLAHEKTCTGCTNPHCTVSNPN